MILWRNIENYPFYHFDSDPRFPPFLLYVKWKSGVTFVWRCFRDVYFFLIISLKHRLRVLVRTIEAVLTSTHKQSSILSKNNEAVLTSTYSL